MTAWRTGLGPGRIKQVSSGVPIGIENSYEASSDRHDSDTHPIKMGPSSGAASRAKFHDLEVGNTSALHHVAVKRLSIQQNLGEGE